MTSIFENTHSKVTVHILHDDTLTDDNRRKFLRTAEKYSQCVEFHDVSDMMKNVSGDVISLTINKWSPGSLFRLFIPEIIALDRVIYLIDYKGYVNSGVLIMDLRQMRQKGSLSEMSAEWFSRHRHLATLPDQDALNSIFRGHIKTISGKYNFSDLDEDLSGFIVHTWHHKSWMGFAGFKSDALYWKMFLRSAWGENVTRDELIDIFNGAALKSRYKKNYVNQACSQVYAKKNFMVVACTPAEIFGERSHLPRQIRLQALLTPSATLKARIFSSTS